MLVTIVLMFFIVKVQEVFHFSRPVLFAILFCNLVPRALPGERKREDPGNEVACPVRPILTYCWNFLRVDVYSLFFFCSVFFAIYLVCKLNLQEACIIRSIQALVNCAAKKKTTKTTTNLPLCLTSFMQQNSFTDRNIDLKYGCRQHKCVKLLTPLGLLRCMTFQNTN